MSFRLLFSATVLVPCTFAGPGPVTPAPSHWRLPALFLQEPGGALRLRLPGFEASFSSGSVAWFRGAAHVSVRYPGALAVAPVGREPEGRFHWLHGATPQDWDTARLAFRAVSYPGLLPGIRLEYRVVDGHLESEWFIHPGADPESIRWRYEGATSVSLGADGALRIATPAGEFREAPPFAYQPVVTAKTAVPLSYVVDPDGTVRFHLSPWLREAPLVIDPAVSFSTALGGTGNDVATGVATDTAGNVYVAGYTDSPDFPMSGGRQLSSGGSVDAFVAKFTSAGALVYATYFGGSGDDRAYGLAVDASGNSVIVGSTSSLNLPLASAMQTSYRGARDAFVARLNPAGSSLVFSTYLGGAGLECAYAVALDAQANVYVAGETRSSNFPTKTPYQSVLAGRSDVFLVKLNSAGAQQYGTYLGGTGDDRAYGVATDASGNAYVAGSTESANFPVLNAFQAASGGGQDAFVSKIGAAGSTLAYSTYLGGNGGSVGAPECANGIAVDATGAAYITGVTTSSNFPVQSAWQASIGIGGYDAFVAKLAPAGSTLIYSTYLGGSGQDTGKAISVDAAGLAYIAGSTASEDFPLAGAVQSTLAGQLNGFVAELSAAGTVLVFGTYLGGNSLDSANAIALDSSGAIAVAGQAQSANFPAVNAYQRFAGGDMEAFVTRFSGAGGLQPPAFAVTPSSGTATSQTFTFTYTQPQGASDLAWVEMLFDSDVDPLGGCFVHYERAAQALYLALGTGTAARGPHRLGLAGSVENRQCAIDLGASSASLAGNTLTLNLALRFKPVFQSSVAIYMQSQTNSGTAITWQAKGSWN